MGGNREPYAADSGVKLEFMDSQAMRFNSPVLMTESHMLWVFAVQFLSNLRQFEDIPSPYPRKTKNGQDTKPIMFSGQLAGFYEGGDLSKGINFPVSVHRKSTSLSNPDVELKQLIELKPVLGDDPISDRMMEL